MDVVDAGVLVELLVGRLDPAQLGDEPPAVPHLLDTEVTGVLRRLVLRGDLTEERGAAAMAASLDLELLRFPADSPRLRTWELRRDVGACDATYVALAETLGATALLTTDARLAQVPGVRCAVRLL